LPIAVAEAAAHPEIRSGGLLSGGWGRLLEAFHQFVRVRRTGIAVSKGGTVATACHGRGGSEGLEALRGER
jgi:hypothetical protein